MNMPSDTQLLSEAIRDLINLLKFLEAKLDQVVEQTKPAQVELITGELLQAEPDPNLKRIADQLENLQFLRLPQDSGESRRENVILQGVLARKQDVIDQVYTLISKARTGQGGWYEYAKALDLLKPETPLSAEQQA